MWCPLVGYARTFPLLLALYIPQKENRPVEKRKILWTQKGRLFSRRFCLFICI